MPAVTIYRAIGILLLAGALVPVFYHVELVLDVALPGEADVADPAVEAAYEACYATKDHELHATAFGTIDNPDVQREFINSHRAAARAECRKAHPASTVRVATPARFNLVDLEPRYW